jgi:hypothetical protein
MVNEAKDDAWPSILLESSMRIRFVLAEQWQHWDIIRAADIKIPRPLPGKGRDRNAAVMIMTTVTAVLKYILLYVSTLV